MKNLNKSYFKTSYASQFKEKVGFKNPTKSFRKEKSGFHNTDRLNEYSVKRGIPENSNYISACYPPIQLSKSGINEAYLNLKRYSPIYQTDKRSKSINNSPSK